MLKDKRPQMAAMYEEGMPLRLVAEKFGCSISAVHGNLKAHGVQTRPCGQPNNVTNPWRRSVNAAGEQAIAQHYASGASIKEVAKRVGIGRKAVVNALARQGVALRSPLEAAHARMANEDKLGPRVKSRHRQSDGYVVAILSRDHPHFGMASKTGRVLEHRLLMAEALVRDLAKNETVHHINGIRDDNRLENLQLRQGKHGTGVRMRCCDCGSFNVQAATLDPPGEIRSIVIA